MKPNPQEPYDIVIIGAGASGSALFYTLARYSTGARIALIEKYDKPGQVNSKASNNSQTLHVGDIETNYSLSKAKNVYPAAMMVVEYGKTLSSEERDKFLFPIPKMLLAVGKEEVATLEERYESLKSLFPELKKLSREEITLKEPLVTKGRNPNTDVRALYTETGYAVNFEQLSRQFIEHGKALRKDFETFFSETVLRLKKEKDFYLITTKSGVTITARTLVVNADSYSLLLAQQLGYGKEFSLIPIAGNFYFSGPILQSKIYTVQDPKLPFAAVHGDPDITDKERRTRWGPTARFHPVLEARKYNTFFDFAFSSGFHRLATWRSFLTILLDPVRFRYLLLNMLYELPVIGKMMFIKNVRKIVPTARLADMQLAKGYGGMRLQRVNTKTREMLLGEGKIVGDRAIFNMTPSPGASVCLYNALRDAEIIRGFLGEKYSFDRESMIRDLYKGFDTEVCLDDVSQKETYAS